MHIVPAQGIGWSSEDLGMGLSSGARFLVSGIGLGFGRFVWTFGRALRMQECVIVFGIVQLAGKPGEKRKHCKFSRKGLEARRWEGV